MCNGRFWKQRGMTMGKYLVNISVVLEDVANDFYDAEDVRKMFLEEYVANNDIADSATN